MAIYDRSPRARTEQLARMTPVPDQPGDFEALRAMVIERRDALPKRIAQIAAYALDNPDEVAFGTAASIAASAGVQPSTLIRFAQTLGFDGFTSLQGVFRERLRERNSSYEDRLKTLRGGAAGQTEIRGILDGFVDAASRSLDAAARNFDDDRLEQAVNILKDADTIYLLARRRSYPVASYMAYALGKLGIRYQIIESSAGLDPEILSFASPRDAVVAVSFSPYASTTIDSARSLARQGVPVAATVWFEVAEADCAGFRSMAATMALAMTLAVAVAERRRSA
jgi:DNA-binding MurR/RpiR family transcriptional regulator